MESMTSPHSLTDMINAVTKTFIIAHEQDSDEHLAKALVYNAGRMAWRMRETGVNTEFKTSVSDVVTDADRGAEQFVAGALESLRPEDGLIGEEGASRPSTSGRTWIIDPVDGTYNFTAGNDYWCSALALVEGDPADPTQVLLGAVHRPAMGYTWFGGPAIPSTRDGQGVEKLIDAPVDQLCLGSYLHPRFMKDDAIRETWLRVASEFATVRMLGSASVDLGSVADGSLDVWMQHSVADWDWLPGRALVEGAGGACTKLEAGGVIWSIAGNSQAVSQVVELLAE
ncbi:inositol monophosphatase family protein [Corynebacterium sp. A21]|uniref:inositol monophosphatase family protein n=1 Tax=Corynebacterium sp. A21 TaxID=3457318 RepID=UPI003FCF1E1E